MFGGSKRNGNGLDTRGGLRAFRSGGARRKGYEKQNPALGGVSLILLLGLFHVVRKRKSSFGRGGALIPLAEHRRVVMTPRFTASHMSAYHTHLTLLPAPYRYTGQALLSLITTSAHLLGTINPVRFSVVPGQRPCSTQYLKERLRTNTCCRNLPTLKSTHGLRQHPSDLFMPG